VPAGPTPTVPQPTDTAVPTVAPAPVEVELVPLDNPVAGFSISRPEGWVYSADIQESYFAENDQTLQSGDPTAGAMLLISSMPLRELEEYIGTDPGAEDVFTEVAGNLFRTRGALIGDTAPRQFGSLEGVGGQVMWVDAQAGARVQAYLATAVVQSSAVVMFGFVEDVAWSTTWPVFDAMLNSMHFFDPQPPGDAARGEIASGERAQAELTAGWADNWTFTSPGEEYISVSVEAVGNRWDPYLEVYDADSELLADDDDGGEMLNAHLGAVWLSQPGTYTIYVSGYYGTGLYEIELNRVEPVGGGLDYGQSVVEELAAFTEWHVWTFDGDAGEAVSIKLKAEQSDLDAVLDLYDPGGHLRAFGNAAASDAAAVEGFILPDDGRYRVVARSANDTAGRYRLDLDRLESVGGGVISYSQPVTGTIFPNEEQEWTVEAEEGDLLTFSVEALGGDLDSYLTLLAPDGTPVATDDNSGIRRDAMIEGYSVPVQGLYTVVAGAGPSVAGTYRLSVGPTAVEGALAYGETVSGTVELGIRDNWLFEGQAGDKVTITVVRQSEELDSYLELYALDAEQLAVDDESGEGGDPRIAAFELPEDGTYRVAVSGYAGEQPGDYELTLTRE
jgi:hypothetical protein